MGSISFVKYLIH